MTDLLSITIPELILVGAACVLFFLGCSRRTAARGVAAWLALGALLSALVVSVYALFSAVVPVEMVSGSLRLDNFGRYIRVLGLAVGVILLLLAWPTRADRTGNSALRFGGDAGEFYAMFLLSIAGLLLVAVADDLIVLFLALELMSIPTYIMVSISRPIAAAQEAAVKYFFLGALSIAVMLLGFSYLYGSTGQIRFAEMSAVLRRSMEATGALPRWQMFGVILVLIGFAYKMAAFPLHFYAGDVYEGAATPVTAFLAFVPKTAGFVALIRLLTVVGGDHFMLPPQILTFLWVLAALTMTIGNVLALLQNNVKRVMAYSSVAHSGYMLVGIAALFPHLQRPDPRPLALSGVLFYLAAYGIMNCGVFGVLMLLPARDGRDDSAETFTDLAGQGWRHLGLGLGMAACCLSLIGIPLTVGFLGKLMLIRPALAGGLTWLAIILVINAAVSATYYLHIIGAMFLRPEGAVGEQALSGGAAVRRPQFAVGLGVVLSVTGTLLFGAVPPAAQILTYGAELGAEISCAQPIAPAATGPGRVAADSP